MQKAFCLSTFYFTLVLGLYTHAQSAAKIRTASGEIITVSAKNYSGDLDSGISELTGDVRIVFKDQILQADRVTIFQKDEVMDATGNVSVTSPTTTIVCDHTVLNYSTNTGWFQNGFVQSGQVIFEGKIVRKLGPTSYSADQAYYTACTTCPSAWTFSGSRIDAELGGYTYIKNSVLEVGGLPIFWLPYLVVPLKSERQSGFLPPSIGVEEENATFELPFFWAISRSQDATLTFKNYGLRGPKGHVNYRYVLSEKSVGELNFAYIDDLKAQSEGNRSNRWFTTYMHSYELPSGFSQKAMLNIVSDLKYPKTFPREIGGDGDSALENRVSLTRNTEHLHLSLDADYYINLLHTSPLAENRDAVHRFPEIRIATSSRRLWNSKWYYSLNANYINFAREDFSYDDVEDTTDPTKPTKIINPNRSGSLASGSGSSALFGSFTPDKDIIRAGQRFDIMPEISRPFKIMDEIDFVPSASVRVQQYAFNLTLAPNQNYDTQPGRQYLRTKFSFRTRFSRVFGTDAPENLIDSKRPSSYKHEFEPELVFGQVPWLSQTDTSFFGKTSSIPVFLEQQPLSDSDFFNLDGTGRGVQFDTFDWVTSRDYVRLSFNNKLIRKEWRDGEASYRQVANLKLWQSYDINEARRPEAETRFPWSDLAALLDVRFDSIDMNSLVRYFPHHRRVNSSSRLRLKNPTGDFFELSYAQSHTITQKIEESNQTPNESLGVGAGYQSKYVGLNGGVAFKPENFRTLSFKLQSWNAELRLRPPGNCIGIVALMNYNIADKSPSYAFKFDYNFGGGF